MTLPILVLGRELRIRAAAEDGGRPWVRFDNAHAVDKSRGYRRKRAAYDHWHRSEKDKGRPYHFTTAIQLLDDFWKEVRTLNEKGVPNVL